MSTCGNGIVFRKQTAGIFLLLLQALIIVALLWQRARRRKAEIDLGKSEERFFKAFRQSPLAITMISVRDGRYVEVNETFESQTGWKRDEVIDRTLLEIDLWIDINQRTAFLGHLLAGQCERFGGPHSQKRWSESDNPPFIRID
jgi:PAS domain-containing protein